MGGETGEDRVWVTYGLFRDEGEDHEEEGKIDMCCCVCNYGTLIGCHC